MGQVTFVSERGVPHAALKVGQSDWYGFKPRLEKFPVAPGLLDRSRPTAEIKHTVIFSIDDAIIARELPKVVSRYQHSWYKVGVLDCVSFVADVAEALGLRIPNRPNFLPDEFVIRLSILNAGGRK